MNATIDNGQEELIRASGRTPPQSLEAEQAVCGGVQLPGGSIPVGLRAEDFYRSQHRVIFQGVLELEAKNTPPDFLTLCEHLEKTGQLEAAGGRAYIAALSEAVPSTANLPHYAKIIREKARARNLQIEAHEGANDLSDPTIPFEKTQRRLTLALDRSDDGASRTKTSRECSADLFKAWTAEKRPTRRALETGIRGIDQMLTIKGGDLIVVAGAVGDGKTMLMEQILLHAARAGVQGLYDCLEMSPGEMHDRAIATLTGLSLDEIHDPSPSQGVGALKAAESLAALPITYMSEHDPDEMIREANRRHRRGQLDALFLDYLQLASLPSSSGDTRDQRIGTLTRRLKRLAMDLQIPVIVGSQLRRAERASTALPTLSDLRESGSIEQDANAVIILRVPGKIEGTPEYRAADTRTAFALLAKNRGGRTGKIPLVAEWSRFQFKDSIREVRATGTYAEHSEETDDGT